MRKVRVVGLALVACLALAACTAVPVSKAGGVRPVVTLRIGAADPTGRFPTEVSRELARQVADATDGGVRLVPVDDVGRDAPHDFDQLLAQQVIDGDLDLAVVPARAWDVLGITSFQALYAPFLITDDALLDAVTTSDVAASMLDGLDGSGVQGLALVPGGMRHVFGVGDVPLGPGDYAGATVRTPHSEVTWSMFRALGATPVDTNGPAFGLQLASGEIDAAESLLSTLHEGTPDLVVLGDVIPYPSVLSLVIGTEALGRLAPDQRTALRAAAAATTAWAVETLASDANQARELCSSVPGTRVILAGPAAVDALRRATAPVTDRLAKDPATSDLIDRIRAIDRTTPAPTGAVQACGAPVPLATPDPSGPPSVPATFPEGTYRRDVTLDALLAAGVDEVTARHHAAVWSLTLKDGVLVDPGCPGTTYTTTGGRLTVTSGPTGPDCGEAAGKVLFSAGWHLDGDQMTFTDVLTGHGSDVLIAAIFGGGPFTKIA